MMKRALTAAALTVALAAPAFAQTATPPAGAPAATTGAAPAATSGAGTFVQSQQSTEWLGSKLIGASVYGPDNASIGEISDVVIAGDGKINAVVVGVGGFLGVGTKSVALPFQNISVTRKPDSASIDKITVSYTKDQLKDAPTFAYYDPKPAATTGSGARPGAMGGSTGGSMGGSPSPMSPTPATPKQ